MGFKLACIRELSEALVSVGLFQGEVNRGNKEIC